MLVGHLAAIFRYPVKSMAAQPLDEAAVSWHGLDGDRRWAFVRPGQESNGFPWLTIRRRNDLVRYQVVGESQVRTPDGRLHDVTDPALAAELGAARVQKLDRGTFDSAPLSLITTRSAGAEPLRFRPNLL
ncbi:MOSC N-terminal beta barrel domain-containing protein [Amycolatopsis methanolica]|uniref:MOSC domain containing protein n=2 Tax=Amycolatopsis methanolica group TaxID=2893674 RepID=A0A076MZR7_AMYME|nr:MOSC N-terminal beta barrel domain-containing protein [Amycolatopsis methanolica]AIJ24401.1 MOSC domain containing protein [Amycolatopsis methanolica 239]